MAFSCIYFCRILLVILIIVASLDSASSYMYSSTSDTTSMNTDNGTCSLYLAPSSIPSAGLGIYAGKSYTVGQRIGQPTIGIPVTDPYAIYDAEELITEYGWNSANIGGGGEAETVFHALPGPAMMTNFHASLGNVLPGGLEDDAATSTGTCASTNALADRNNEPPPDVGAGASTAYHDFTLLAKTDISPGQEIFASIGEDWFAFLEERKGIKVPTKANYEEADKIVQSLQKFRKRHSDTVSDAKFVDILLRTKTEMMQGGGRWEDKEGADKVASLLPATLAAFLEAADKGTARAQLNERSLAWLSENGMCLDSIKEGKSTVPHAGRGAFATRSIAKGSVITPIPLVQIMDNTTLDTEPIHGREISKRQLLLNYCFGHRTMPMLLCPTTAGALANHDKKRANAKIRWSNFPAIDKDKSQYAAPLVNLHPSRMGMDARLVFDLVATEDIAEGDEILINYGDEWEDAWKQHVKSWKDQDFSDYADYVPASIMNAEQWPIILSNDASLKYHTYLCRLEPFATETAVHNMPVEDYRAHPLMEPHTWNNFTRAMFEDNDYIWWWPCDVVGIDRDEEEENDGTHTFRTVVYQKSTSEDGADRKIIRKLKNVPRHAIRFIDKQYHSHQHLASAFRHYIPIQDDIFPLHWRDDYQTAESMHLGEKNIGASTSSEEQEKINQEYEVSVQEATCGVYVAPSNIKGAGLGVFLGVSMPGKGFTLGSPIPIIPVVDMTREEDWAGNDYTWSAGTADAEYESNRDSHVTLQTVNEGCMSNFHPGLVNFEMSHAKYMPSLDRRIDPGAGAFSDYVDFSFESRFEVAAGEEVYISYGESWFLGREHLGKIPLSANYREANKLVASMVSVSNGDGSVLDEASSSELLDIVKDDIVRNDRTKGVLSSYHNVQELIDKVVSRNGTAEATSKVRSPEWLEENGYCLDNIYAKQSTIDQAGLGAFARRPIRKGQVIIPAPLWCTWGRHMFHAYGDHMPDTTNKILLAYNYQYAHPHSSVLFFPTTTSILINHRSQRGSGPKPNAELRWSQTDKRSQYFLQRPLSDLKKQHYATMVIDFVAIRDIKPGEEVTIDYGDEWDDAWKKHVHEFASPCPEDNNSPCFKSSKMVASMNKDKFNEAYHAWTEDHFTLCERESMPVTDDAIISIVPKQVGTDTSNEIARVGNDGNMFRFSFRGIESDHEGFDLADIDGDWYPCQILRADEQDELFDVVYFTYESMVGDDDTSVLRRNRALAAEKLKFLNKPYKSDMHWDGAFRHEIKVPDSIYPALWKDLLNEDIIVSS